MKSILLLALLLAGCNRFYYVPSKKTFGDPAQHGFAYADYHFPSASGNTLHGRFFSRKEGTPRKGLWVFFHGSGRNLTGSYSMYAWVMGAGWDYFIFDYSGYGRSGGKPNRESVFRDGLAALDFALDSLPTSSEGKLVLSGESLGGAALLASAQAWERKDRASLIFVDCTFPTYQKAGRALMAERFYSWPLQFMVPWVGDDAHSPEPGMGRLAGIPILITHCRDDRKIPIRLGRELHSIASEPKRFWDLGPCAHTQGFTDRFPENKRALLAYVDSLTFMRGSR